MAISRLFVEIGGDTSKLNAALKESLANVQSSGLEITKAGKSFLSAFDNALDPARKLTDQIKLLEAAGKSQAEITQVMGDKIVAMADKAAAAGKPIDDLVSKYTSFESKLKTIGSDLTSTGENMSKYLTLPLAAMGAAFVAAASEVGEAMNTIRAHTGATGDALAGLGTAFKDVFHDVPDSAHTVATAISDLNVRLGLTGKPLEEMTTQFLNLARLTGSEVGPLIATTTRLFNEWGVATEKQGGTLDYLFKVTQSTGIGVQRLDDLLVQFGAPLKEMGFSLQQAAAMLGNLEKSGVNVEASMTALRTAFGNFAKAGKDPVEALDKIIASIKGAKTEAEAMEAGMAVFGKRGGAAFTEAIRSGRVDVDALMKSIAASKTTINETEEANRTFGESLKIIKNQAELALQPLGVELVKALKSMAPAIESAVAWIANLVKSFTAMDPIYQKAVLGFAAIAAAAGPITAAIGGIMTGISSLIGAFGAGGSLVVLLNPLTLAITAGAVAFALLATNILSAVDANQKLVDGMAPADHMSAAMAARVKELEDKLASQGVVIKKTGLTVDEYVGQLIMADTSMKKLNDTLGTGLGKWDPIADVVNKVKAATQELTPEQEKLLEAYKKTIQPLTEVAEKFSALEAIGADFSTYVDRNWKSIVEMGKAEIDLQGHLSGTAAQLYVAALAHKELDDELKNNSYWSNELQKSEEALYETTKKVSDSLNQELIDKIKKYSEAWKDSIEVTTKGAYTDFKSYLPSDADVKKAADAAEKILVPASKYVKSMGLEMKSALDSCFTSLTSNLAKSTIEWQDWGKSLLSFVKSLAADLLDIFLKSLLNPLMSALGGLAQGFGNWLGGLLGGTSSSTGLLGSITAALSGTTGTSVSGIGGIGSLLLKSLPGVGTVAGLLGLGGTAAAATGTAIGTGIITGGSLGGSIVASEAAAAGASGAAGAAAGSSMLSSIGAFLTNPWTIAAAGAAVLGYLGYKFATGKNAWEAGAPEAQRDFGINISSDQFQGFAQNLGLSESQTYPIRKELESSPLFLELFGGNADINKLKAVSYTNTAGQYATADFSAAFQTAKATGDFTALNKIWLETVGTSSALAQVMPDYQSKLLLQNDATKAAAEAASTAATTITTATAPAISSMNTLAQAIQVTGREASRGSVELNRIGEVRAGVDHELNGTGQAALITSAHLSNSINDLGRTFASVKIESDRIITSQQSYRAAIVAGAQSIAGAMSLVAGAAATAVPVIHRLAEETTSFRNSLNTVVSAPSPIKSSTADTPWTPKNEWDLWWLTGLTAAELSKLNIGGSVGSGLSVPSSAAGAGSSVPVGPRNTTTIYNFYAPVYSDADFRARVAQADAVNARVGINRTP